MKILAVDDDSYILEILTIIAARAGFKDVSTALSGEIALKLLNKSDTVFDCLLLDISMPGMDGIELCSLARAMPGYSRTPIIMLTAMAERSYIDGAFRAGATDYANKPFDIVELYARLRMAEELVTARQMVTATSTNAGEVLSEVESGSEINLSDEVQLDGVNDLIEYTALSNYLTQLSNAGIAGSQVMAMKIDRIESIFARASRGEFLYALTEVAGAISDTLRINGYLMMAYAGHGTFFAVSGKATIEPAIKLETEIQCSLDDLNLEYDNGDPLDIEISIGNPLRPSTSNTQRVKRTFARAIARAENRVLKKRSQPRLPTIRLFG